MMSFSSWLLRREGVITRGVEYDAFLYSLKQGAPPRQNGHSSK